VDDSEHVGAGDGLAHLEDKLHRLLDGKWAALMDASREILAVEKLHFDVGRAVGKRVHLADACDMLALEDPCNRRPGYLLQYESERQLLGERRRRLALLPEQEEGI
jgi:hypothetical protein